MSWTDQAEGLDMSLAGLVTGSVLSAIIVPDMAPKLVKQLRQHAPYRLCSPTFSTAACSAHT